MDPSPRICNVTLMLAACILSSMPVSRVEAGDLQKFTFRQPSMGTLFQLTLYADDQLTANRAAKAAFDRILALDEALSDYKAESELNKLCSTSGTSAATHVSADLWSVLKFSKSLCEETGGAFDVTIGPLVKLWRTARETKILPDGEALRLARERVDCSLIQLDKNGQRVTLSASGMQLDLGGVAKGYALDAVIEVIREKFGITQVLIDGGGDVFAGDPPPGREHWNVAVRNPKNEAEPWIIPLANAALATSGDLHQFVEIGDVRYSHIVDPSTGMGLTHQMQVSVLAPTGTEADALASAVSVLGNPKGLEFIETHSKCETLIVYSDAGQARTVSSKAFPLKQE
ncbi:MAG: FAD:protein FMN transferase [Verrucomicrobiales bacterium]